MPDISNVVVDTEVVRMDSMLYLMKSPEELQLIRDKYPVFCNLYFYRILNFSPDLSNDSLYVETRQMLASETFNRIGRKVHNQYDDIADIVHAWREAMKYCKYYFQQEVPDLYTTVTEFAFASFIFSLQDNKDAVGLSMDMYLGDSVDYAAMARMDASFSEYNSRTFNRDHLIKKAVEAVVDDKILPPNGPIMLDHLIHAGKKIYILEKLLPHTSDTVIWEYTPRQLAWVQDNERNIYNFLVTEELFYSRQRSDYIRLLQAAPSSPNMPPDAPGRAVVYIAYKIIDSFMTRHPGTTLIELAGLDANTIFQQAKYKPRVE